MKRRSFLTLLGLSPVVAKAAHGDGGSVFNYALAPKHEKFTRPISDGNDQLREFMVFTNNGKREGAAVVVGGEPVFVSFAKREGNGG